MRIPRRNKKSELAANSREGWLAMTTARQIVAVTALVLTLLGQSTITPRAEPSEDWNVQDMGRAYVASNVLTLCVAGLARNVSRAEWELYVRLGLKKIKVDALKRDPQLDLAVVKADALRSPGDFGAPVVSAPWLCDWARIALSSSLWRRLDANVYADDGTQVGAETALRDALKQAGCAAADPCVSTLMRTLERKGLLLGMEGPYCRANRDECARLQRVRDANIPVLGCDFAADKRKCERAVSDQRQRFMGAREQKR
jgi:hypothetical protein